MRYCNGHNYESIGIIGSFRKQMDAIAHAKDVFEKNGFKVLAPKTTTITGSNEIAFVLLETDKDESPRILEKNYLKALLASDAVFVCNTNGYIGASAMFELGYLISKGQEVFFLEEPLEPLISSLIHYKYMIGTPEKVCNYLKETNKLWNSRDWFDKDHERKADFTFDDRQYADHLELD